MQHIGRTKHGSKNPVLQRRGPQWCFASIERSEGLDLEPGLPQKGGHGARIEKVSVMKGVGVEVRSLPSGTQPAAQAIKIVVELLRNFEDQKSLGVQPVRTPAQMCERVRHVFKHVIHVDDIESHVTDFAHLLRRQQ